MRTPKVADPHHRAATGPSDQRRSLAFGAFPAQVDALLGLGCEYGQGFFFHRPVDPEQITALFG